MSIPRERIRGISDLLYIALKITDYNAFRGGSSVRKRKLEIGLKLELELGLKRKLELELGLKHKLELELGLKHKLELELGLKHKLELELGLGLKHKPEPGHSHGQIQV